MTTPKEFVEQKSAYIEDFTWNTAYEIPNNTDTMNEWLELYLPDDYELIEESIDQTYAEIIDGRGHKFAVHASGNGDFYHHKIEFELIHLNFNKFVYKDILDNDNLLALDMLVNEKPMTSAEKTHLILNVDWSSKLNSLKLDSELFNKKQLRAIEKLTQNQPLNTVEKQFYIQETNLPAILEKLSEKIKAKLKVNNITKIKSNNVPDISDVKIGDKILMLFEKNNTKEHFWCTVDHLENRSQENKSNLLSISINDDNKIDENNFIQYGLSNEKKALFFNYCKAKNPDLKISENAYNKRVIEVKHIKKPSSKLKL